MTKYAPYITTRIDDEFGVQNIEGYDSENQFDSYDEALEELEELAKESEGEFGVLELEDGKIVRRYVLSDDDYIEPDDRWAEVDYNPYTGSYEYDYESEDSFGEEW